MTQGAGRRGAWRLPRRMAITACLAGALLVATALWLDSRILARLTVSAPSSDRIAPAGELLVADAAMPPPVVQGPTGARQSPPPAAGATPLDDLTPADHWFEAYAAAARAGDPWASCQLAHEIRKCEGLASLTAGLRGPPPGDDASEQDVARFVEREASRRELLQQAEQHCSGLPRGYQQELPAFLANAARGGYVAALYDAAVLPLLDAGALVRDQAFLTFYRNELWPLFSQALRTGDPQLVGVFLWSTRRADRSPLAAVLPASYQSSEAALAFALMIADESSARALAARSPPPSPEAYRQADAWALELFPGGMPRQQAVRLDGLTLTYDSGQVSSEQRCADERRLR